MPKKQLNNMTLEEMNIEIYKTARIVNQRLSRYEKRSINQFNDPAGLGETSYRAIGEIVRKTAPPNFRPQQPRFTTAKAKNVQEARRRLKQMRRAETIEGTNIRKIDRGYEVYKNNFNDKYDVEFTTEEFKQFLRVMNMVDTAHVPSDQVVQIFEEINKAQSLGTQLPFNPKNAFEIANYINNRDFAADEIEALNKGKTSASQLFE